MSGEETDAKMDQGTEAVQAEAEVQAIDGVETTQTGEPQGDGADDKFDSEKLLADLQALQKNYEGLRKKLSETEKATPVTAADLAEELQGLESEDDKKAAARFVEILSKAGVGKQEAKDLLKAMGELYEPEDPKEFMRNEMEKLGPQGKQLIGELRQFQAAMKQSGDWTPDDFGALEIITQTADGVKLIAKILHSTERMRAGQFSTYAPAKENVEELTNRDRIAMYERAYAKMYTAPEEARQELQRLERMFEK